MPGDKPRVVVSLLDKAQEFQRFQGEDAVLAAAAAGIDVQVLYAENNPILQIQQLYKALQGNESTRPHAIVVETITGEGLERVARAAVKANVGWVLINRQVPYLGALREAHPALAIGSVSTDQLEIGRIQGRQFRALVPGEGFVLYVQGPPDTSAAQQRLAGAVEVLKDTPLELKVVDGQWTDDSGEQTVRRWLRLKRHDTHRPAVIGCQNDHMAVGARRALMGVEAAADLARIPLTGVDGLADSGRRLVSVGQLAATVVVPSNTGPAIRLLADALLRGAAFPAETLLAPASYPEIAKLASPSSAWRRPSASSM